MESLTRKIFAELMFALARIAKFGFLLSMDVEIVKIRFWDDYRVVTLNFSKRVFVV